MGNCCCPESDESKALTSGGRRPQAFQGEVRRIFAAVPEVFQKGPMSTDDCSFSFVFFSYLLHQTLQGHRLGTAHETGYQNSAASASPMQRDENIPEPVLDKNLTEEERAKIRADRAAAAEARLKKQGGAPPKKKKTSSDAPLRGPNSKPTMTWTAG